jgi:hypothetical protein
VNILNKQPWTANKGDSLEEQTKLREKNMRFCNRM